MSCCCGIPRHGREARQAWVEFHFGTCRDRLHRLRDIQHVRIAVF